MKQNKTQSIMGAAVIMPAFNEEKTIGQVIDLVLDQSEVRQLIVVDDCSTDSTPKIVLQKRDKRIIFIQHEFNKGKGAAIRTAQSKINQPIVIIQDADLEYDPKQYSKLIEPIRLNLADVVYGSRFQTGEMRRVLYFWHYVGNRFLTLLSNAFTNINLSDMETCYKVIRSDFFRQINIKESRFGFEPEITGKLAAMGARFYEVSISYNGRTYEEGKKIGVRDGFRAIWCILKYNKSWAIKQNR
jgi:glycosyltransferase involved in cell wall biosynthesis